MWQESMLLYRQLSHPLEKSVAKLLVGLEIVQWELVPIQEFARDYLGSAGFEVQPGPDPKTLLCRPKDAVWQTYFTQPLLTKVFCDMPLDLDSVMELVHEAESMFQVAPEGIFVIVNENPTDGAWLQIGAVRGDKGVRVMPIDHAILYAGQQKNRHRGELLDYLENLFLGPRRDLYDRQNPISDRLNFFGREKIADCLMEDLARGHAVALFGLRKMGKSSLLNYLRDKLPCPVSLVDLQAGAELGGVYTRILHDWGTRLKVLAPRFEWTPPTFSRGCDSLNLFTSAARELLTRMEKHDLNGQLVLLVDEIELIVPRGRTGLSRFLSFARAVRGLFQECPGRFGLVIAGVDPTVVRTNRFAGEQNPFYNFFREEYLPPLSSEDCIQMIRNIGVQMGLQYQPDALDFVAETSGGHPYWARKLCSLAFHECEGGHPITMDCLRSVAQRFIQEPSTAHLLDENGLWGEISDPYLWPKLQVAANQKILLSLAGADQRRKDEIVGQVLQRSAFNASLYELNQRSVLAQSDSDMYWIHLRLFRNWIRNDRLGEE
jgi:hypothetical protein